MSRHPGVYNIKLEQTRCKAYGINLLRSHLKCNAKLYLFCACMLDIIYFFSNRLLDYFNGLFSVKQFLIDPFRDNFFIVTNANNDLSIILLRFSTFISSLDYMDILASDG